MDIQYYKGLLRERDLKATSPRLDLLMSMDSYESAMPYSVMQKSLKSIDRVTLYRTLESLKQKGIIHKAYQENSDVYYAICGHSCKKDQHEHDHIHFKCTECELVTCEKTAPHLKISIPDYIISSTSIYLEGICKGCQA